MEVWIFWLVMDWEQTQKAISFLPFLLIVSIINRNNISSRHERRSIYFGKIKLNAFWIVSIFMMFEVYQMFIYLDYPRKKLWKACACDKLLIYLHETHSNQDNWRSFDLIRNPYREPSRRIIDQLRLRTSAVLQFFDNLSNSLCNSSYRVNGFTLIETRILVWFINAQTSNELTRNRWLHMQLKYMD